MEFDNILPPDEASLHRELDDDEEHERRQYERRQSINEFVVARKLSPPI